MWVEKVPGVDVNVVPEVLLEAVVVVTCSNILLKDKLSVFILWVPLNDVTQRRKEAGGLLVFLGHKYYKYFVYK